MADSERSASGVLVLLLWAAELPSRLLTGSIFPMPFVRADRFCLFPACCTPVRSVGLNLIFSRAIALIDVNVFSLPPLYLKKHLIWELLKTNFGLDVPHKLCHGHQRPLWRLLPWQLESVPHPCCPEPWWLSCVRSSAQDSGPAFQARGLCSCTGPHTRFKVFLLLSWIS